jgi:molecular chaperone HscB
VAVNEYTCWNCGAQNSGHFCPACQRIQPIEPGTDYFTFFQLPRRFNIDTAQLETQFYDLSRKFHPDFFFNAGESERQYSMDRSSKLNDAYRTLKDPLKRARYLLELEGVKIGQSKAPQDLLAEVFELNEEMEELRAAKRKHADHEVEQLKRRIQEMEDLLKGRNDELNRGLREAFDKWDTLSPASANRRPVLDEVNELLMNMSYINNLIDDIEEEL